MSSLNPWEIRGQADLSAGDQAATEALAAVCNAAEGLVLKLRISDPPPAPDASVRHFLVHAGDTLIGYAGLDGDGPEVEVCGMVHPGWRRQGIGRALLAAVVAACRAREVRELLLICEAASVGGRALAASVGAPYAFGEDGMELDLDTTAMPPPGTPTVTLTQAGEAEAATLAAIEGAVFGDPVARTIERVLENLTDPATQYYLAWVDDVTVGSGRLVAAPDRAYLYAFGVLPAYRGRGLGRAFLGALCTRLRARGTTCLALEVETENAPAIALYKSCGFQPITTYGYYAVPLGG